MKKLFFSSIFAMLCLAINAQDLNIGVGGGYLYNKFSLNRYEGYGYEGFKVEMVGDYTLPSGYVFSSGLAYSEKGGTITGYKIGDANHINQVEAYPMRYITAPFLAGYRFQLGKLSVMPQVGLYAGIGIGSKGYLEGYRYQVGGDVPFRERVSLFSNPKVSYYSAFNRFDGGLMASVNLTFDRIRLKGYYEQSLHQMHGLWGDPRHRSIGLSLIVMWKR